MAEEFKSNSMRSKMESGEKKEVKKVIKGEATTKKKSSGQKFADDFLSEDIKNVKSYVVFDVLIPALKDTVYDMITSGLGMMLGNSRSNSGRKSNSRDSYSDYYKSSNRRYDYSKQGSNGRSTTRGRKEVDDILLDSRAEAEEVIDALEGIIDEYQMASIADLYELVGLKSNYTDNNYGWFDIGSASIARVRDGYLLKMPRPTLLD